MSSPPQQGVSLLKKNRMPSMSALGPEADIAALSSMPASPLKPDISERLLCAKRRDRSAAFAECRNKSFLSVPRDLLQLLYLRGVKWLGNPMRALKGVIPIVVSVGLISAVTAVLWRLNSTAAGSYHLVYIYLFPVALIAGLYGGRLALLGTAVALICADYFLQKPLYILGNDDPLEYGDLFVFALLAITAIKFIRELLRPRISLGVKSRSA
jgi:hypothetical protein